ncbi:MAG: MFS transporter [Lactobacillales bacterium]|jgi:EmrB/QacA subfamily drug resistance transporter|nr:MFS transporter [Lactobacillales bacterium]
MTETKKKVTIRQWFILVAVGLFSFMSTLDSSIVNIALPTISRETNIPMNQTTWTVSIYLIGVSSLLILFGRLGDLLGKIKIFRIGTIIFTFGSFIAGVNLGIWFLLFARFIQSIGAAMTMSNSFGITSSSFPARLQGRAMSLIGIFVSLGAVTGPALGGILLQFLPWSYIFWINVPVGLIAILLGAKLFPKSHPRKKITYIDWRGTILFFGTISSLFLGIEIGQVSGFLYLSTMVLFFISIFCFGGFIHIELICDKPLLDLRMFKNALFSISILSAMFIFITNFFASIIMPFYLQNLRDFSPGTAGLMMMTFPVIMLIIGPIGGILGDKFDKEWITFIGLFFVVFAQLGYTHFQKYTSITTVILFTGINACGAALFQAPNNALVMSSVDKKSLGIAGSINALARNLGMVTGISIATTTLFTSMSHQVGHRVTSYIPNQPDVFLKGMHISFYISFILALATLFITAYRLFTKKKQNAI